MGWVDGAVVGLDTETTGLDVTTDRVVSAAVVRRHQGTTTVRSWLVDPGVDVPAAATAVHGITNEHARRHGSAPADALDAIAQELAGALLRGEPLVAFNASFDLSIIDAELRRHGLPTLPERIGREVRVVLDPLLLDRTLDRLRHGRRRLVDLCAYYRVTGAGRLHTADVDVHVTLEVLDALTRRFPEIAAADLEVLHDRQVGAHRHWVETVNTWRLAEGLPGAARGWPLRLPEPVLS